jgi:hypothetical protein
VGSVTNPQRPASSYEPPDHGLIAWTFPSHNIYASGSGAPMTAGQARLSRIRVPYPATITNVLLHVHAAATTSPANGYAALYDSTGARLAVTADVSATGVTATTWSSTGLKTDPFTAPVAVPAGWYWLAVLLGTGASLGFGQSPGSNLDSAGLMNHGLTAGAGNLKGATHGSGLSALPSSFTPSTDLTAAGRFFWAGLS